MGSDEGREDQQADDIGKNHAQHHHVGEIDNTAQADEWSEDDDDAVNNPEWKNTPFTQKVFGRALSVVTPGDDG